MLMRRRQIRNGVASADTPETGETRLATKGARLFWWSEFRVGRQHSCGTTSTRTGHFTNTVCLC